jgi:hypothetical protein
MKLMSLDMLREKSRNKKSKKGLNSKKVEYRLVLELKEKLEKFLLDNDSFMVEVNIRVLGEFLNILSDKLLSMYDYQQVDKNKFVFYNKEIEI